ncbi:MAG: shikimate kinase [Bacteroidota bacterium]
MKIVLLGYMASGKSTIGKQLASALNFSFLDLDTVIETRTALPIPELFEKKGEIFFRKEEHNALKAVLEEENDVVLALGGGTPCYANNMDLILEKATQSVYLLLSIGSLVQRLQNERASRPLVQHLSEDDLPEFIGKHMFERRQYYAQATHTVVCDGKGVEEIVNEILETQSR